MHLIPLTKPDKVSLFKLLFIAYEQFTIRNYALRRVPNEPFKVIRKVCFHNYVAVGYVLEKIVNILMPTLSVTIEQHNTKYSSVTFNRQPQPTIQD